MKSGIYTITCLINKKIYVGSTNNFDTRQYVHFIELNGNYHTNSHLQNAFNKYGKENFIFEILEECNSESCIGLELYWINMLDTKNRKFGYNICTPGKTTLGFKATQETKNKQSLIKIGKKQSKEHIEKRVLKAIGKKLPPCSEERKKKLSELYKGKKRKPFTEQHRKNISIVNSRVILQYDKNMNFIKKYSSLVEANKFTGVSKGDMCNVANNKRKSAGGFIWKHE